MNQRKNRMVHILFLTVLFSGICFAQDSVVPEVVTTSAQFDRVIVVRMKQHTDLLAGLQKAVEKEKIKNAVILSGIGSLTTYHIHVVDNSTFPSKNVFFKDSIPVDLVSVNGYIFNGKVHTHINISDENLALGGHLEPGTAVFTFAIITIGVFTEEINLDRFDDKYWK